MLKMGATTVPNLTAVVPLKVVPSIIDLGAALALRRREGGDARRHLEGGDARRHVPSGVVTDSGPVEAPAGTVAVIFTAELTVNVDAGTPLNVTPVAPVNADPLIVTTLPTGPECGREGRHDRRGHRRNPQAARSERVVLAGRPELDGSARQRALELGHRKATGSARGRARPHRRRAARRRTSRRNRSTGTSPSCRRWRSTRRPGRRCRA